MVECFYLINHVVEHADDETEDGVADVDDHRTNQPLKAVRWVEVSKAYRRKGREGEVRVGDSLLPMVGVFPQLEVVKEVILFEDMRGVLFSLPPIDDHVQVAENVPEHADEVARSENEHHELEEPKQVDNVNLSVDLRLIEEDVLLDVLIL